MTRTANTTDLAQTIAESPIAVSVRDNIFSPVRRFTAAPGSTIADIVDEAGMPDWFPELGTVALNGAIVDSELWHRVRPHAHDRAGNPVIVELVAIPRGGGGRNQQKVMSTAIALSFAIAAGLVSGGALGPLGFGAGLGLGASFLAGGTGAIVASIGISATGFSAGPLCAPGIA